MEGLNRLYFNVIHSFIEKNIILNDSEKLHICSYASSTMKLAIIEIAYVN